MAGADEYKQWITSYDFPVVVDDLLYLVPSIVLCLTVYLSYQLLSCNVGLLNHFVGST